MTDEEKNEIEDDLTVSGFVDELLSAVTEALLKPEVGLNSAKVEERLNITQVNVVEMLVAKRALIRLFDSQGMKGVDGVMQMLFLERPQAAQEGIFRALKDLVRHETPAPKPVAQKPKKRPPWA